MRKSSFCQLNPPILLAWIHPLSFTTSNPKKIEHFEGNDRENIIEPPSWSYLNRSFFRANKNTIKIPKIRHKNPWNPLNQCPFPMVFRPKLSGAGGASSGTAMASMGSSAISGAISGAGGSQRWNRRSQRWNYAFFLWESYGSYGKWNLFMGYTRYT